MSDDGTVCAGMLLFVIGLSQYAGLCLTADANGRAPSRWRYIGLGLISVPVIKLLCVFIFG